MKATQISGEPSVRPKTYQLRKLEDNTKRNDDFKWPTVLSKTVQKPEECSPIDYISDTDSEF